MALKAGYDVIPFVLFWWLLATVSLNPREQHEFFWCGVNVAVATPIRDMEPIEFFGDADRAGADADFLIEKTFHRCCLGTLEEVRVVNITASKGKGETLIYYSIDNIVL